MSAPIGRNSLDLSGQMELSVDEMTEMACRMKTLTTLTFGRRFGFKDGHVQKIAANLPHLKNLKINANDLTPAISNCFKDMERLILKRAGALNESAILTILESNPALKSLGLEGIHVTPRIHEKLMQQTLLEELDLRNTTISNDQIITLMPLLTVLKALRLPGVDDDTLSVISAFLPTLRHLSLNNTTITKECFVREFPEFTHLEALTADFSDFDNEVAQSIANLPQLKKLDLCLSGATDNHIKILSAAKQPLTKLVLSGTRITDVSVPIIIATYPGLRTLDVGATALTPEGVKALKEGLKSLKKLHLAFMD